MKKIKNYFKVKLIKDLIRIKRALAQEGRETQGMLFTYMRYSQGRASKEDMKIANKQFRQFLGALSLGVFAILPFAPITIPAIVKLGRKLGIEILPESFRKDEDNRD